MKKLLLSVSAFGLMAVASVNAQVAKTPFIEHFTQASCGPCASQNPTLYTTLGNFGSANYVKLTYQTSWPGVDPMNASYPNGPGSRVTYYGVSGVPNASLSGGATAGPNTAVTSSTLSAKAAEMTPYDVSISHAWTGASSNDITVTIDVDNVTSSAISSADRIYVAMVEDQVTYASAPGSNGETDFFYVLRQFYDASNGTALSATTGNGIALPSIPGNGTQSYSFTISNANLPSYIADLNELNFVCFVQNDGTKAVEQAAKSTSGSVPGLLDVSTTSNTTVGAGYCDYSFTPSVNFTNNGSTPVTTVTAEYTVNGGTAVSQTYNTAPIAQGATQAITFPVGTLSSGTSTVQYSITDVNSGALYSAGPNTLAAETYTKISATATTTDATAGFDGLALGTAAPTGAIADNPNDIRAYSVDNTISTAVTWNLGGMGQSNGCFRWDYYGINNALSSKLVWGKLDLTGKTDYELKFTHAHAEYAGGEPDQLKVNISTDCGATWTTVWDKTGAALSTVAPLGTGRYYPAVGDWVENVVDLSAYDNAPEILIAFEGISGFGNSLYVDDINSGSTTGINEASQGLNNVTVMPNPVVNNMTVNFTTENSEANILIRNVQGQTVKNISENTVKGANTIEINTTELSAGVYFLSITSDSNVTTKRFVVNK